MRKCTWELNQDKMKNEFRYLKYLEQEIIRGAIDDTYMQIWSGEFSKCKDVLEALSDIEPFTPINTKENDGKI